MSTASFNFARPSRRPRKGARHRGFTLIEVLATLLLIAIVLPAIMKGITLAAAAGTVAKRRTEAATLGQSKIDELITTGEWQTSNLSGDFSPDFPDYRWSAQVQNWQQQQGVQELDLQVTWTARNADQSIVLSTLVYPNAGAGSQTGTGSTGSSGGSSSTGAKTGTGGSTGGAR